MAKPSSRINVINEAENMTSRTLSQVLTKREEKDETLNLI
jgi:hypothetical protein